MPNNADLFDERPLALFISGRLSPNYGARYLEC
jgi:hypothetical protein